MVHLQQQLVLVGGALLCATVSSVPDLRERRIPNWVTGPAMVAGLMLNGFVGHWSGLVCAVFAGLIAGGMALLFWFAGGIGAGDVKLMTAIGCIAGLSSLQLLLLSIAIAGAVFAIAVSAYRGRLRATLSNTLILLRHHRRNGLVPHPDLNLNNPRAMRLPFALAIAAGCLFTLCSVAWDARL